MIRRRRIGACAAVLALWLGGCGSPCEDLAERTCARVGEADAACLKLRQITAAPRAGDDEACLAGIEFVDELRRGR